MADYYSLLARKIAGLPQSTPQTRQAVYDLARRALVNQLRTIQPPVADQVIQNEGRALDEAIARVEREAAAAARPGPKTPEPEKPKPAAPKPAAPPPRPPPEAERGEPERRDEQARERMRPAAPLPPPPQRSSGLRRLLLVAAALIVTVGLVALAALRLRERPEDLTKLNPGQNAAGETDQSKLSARVGAEGGQQGSVQPAAPVARRAALLVGTKAHPEKPDRIYDGSVVWRLENAGGADGGTVLPAVRGDMDFPEAKVKATLLIQKNQDPTLSASHTITVTFDLLPGSDFKGIKAMGALQMRRPETQSGERLVGSLPVPVTENSFLMGLMRGDSEQHNVAMLRAPVLIDIPLQFSDERIGTINLEKGPSGDRVFQDALAAWSR
ncbi:MAG TPA: hypothetical protein VEH76_00070 [Methylocystis sp.]|nr:hypothetical protein [Methylocystis sp.]